MVQGRYFQGPSKLTNEPRRNGSFSIHTYRTHRGGEISPQLRKIRNEAVVGRTMVRSAVSLVWFDAKTAVQPRQTANGRRECRHDSMPTIQGDQECRVYG